MKTINDKHTPGPWIWSGNLVLGAHESHPVAPGRGTVASVGFYADAKKRTLTERQEANARLIAAAPELLDALQWSWGIVNDYWHANTTEERNYFAKDVQHALDKMHAAIAAAKGGAK